MRVLNRITVVLVVWALLGGYVDAQIANTLYFMHGVPQSNRINPAFQPECGFYFGFPLLAPLRSEVVSSSLAYDDVIYQHPTHSDSLITFLHPLGSKDAFLDRLKEVNYISTGFGTSLASIGFRTGAGFFSLNVSSRMEAHLYYPGDLARLAINGAEDGVTYSLDGIGADLTVFDEVSLGWSHSIADNLTLGVRARMMFGIGNLSTIRSDLSVTTSQEVWNLRSDMLVNASLPFADVVYDDDAMIDEIVINEDIDPPSPGDLPKYLFNGKNLGLGIDLGIIYRPMDNLHLSLSLLDLGYISWKDEVHQVSYSTEYDYKGLEVNPFQFSEEYSFGDYLDSTLTQMTDSLSGFLEFSEVGSYAKRQNAKLFVSASYYINEIIHVGVLSRTDLLNNKLTEQVTASVGFKLGRIWNPVLSYSYMNGSYNNIGFGQSLNLGPVNLYFVCDNLLSAYMWPKGVRSVNFWFGFNLVFGYKEKIDLPLVD